MILAEQTPIPYKNVKVDFSNKVWYTIGNHKSRSV